MKTHKSSPKESQQHDSPPPKRVKLRENKKEKVDNRKPEAEEKSKVISAVESSSAEHRGGEPADNSDSEERGPSMLVHESLLSGGAKSNQRASVRKEKFAPPDESEEQRNLRTIFVGNLSSEVAQKRVSH